MGYKYGTFSKFGLVSERTPLSAYASTACAASIEIEEEKKEEELVPRDLTKLNVAKFLDQVHK